MLIPWSERSERNGISTVTRELRRGQVAQRTMRPMVVEVFLPSAGLDPRVAFVQHVRLVQILIAKLAVEAFAQAVLPRRARFDVEHVDA